MAVIVDAIPQNPNYNEVLAFVNKEWYIIWLYIYRYTYVYIIYMYIYITILQ